MAYFKVYDFINGTGKVQVTQFTQENKNTVHSWTTGNRHGFFENDIPVLRIENPDGEQIVRPGDYIEKRLVDGVPYCYLLGPTVPGSYALIGEAKDY